VIEWFEFSRNQENLPTEVLHESPAGGDPNLVPLKTVIDAEEFSGKEPRCRTTRKKLNGMQGQDVPTFLSKR
jgi:hypothetical protein